MGDKKAEKRQRAPYEENEGVILTSCSSVLQILLVPAEEEYHGLRW